MIWELQHEHLGHEHMNMNMNMHMKDLNGMDKHLRETCNWNYLRKWYMVIIWA